MATIIEFDGKQYLLTFSKPETEWISELAKGMGITKEAIVGAAMNKGLTHYVETFAETEVIDKIKEQIEGEARAFSEDETERKEHNKGSCQG